jgi:tetratricopeptide (TPR) repeat protein
MGIEEAVLQVYELNQQITQLYQRGHDQQALGLALQALELIRQRVGEGHPYYADSLDNLAGVYRDMGNYAAAEPLFQQAREIRRDVLGESHLDYADSLGNLAAVFIATARTTDGFALMEQGAHIYVRVIGVVLAGGSES